MNLPEPIREDLAREFRFAADKMAATSDLAARLYFFTALFGETDRAMNHYWDAELALMHLVFTSAHSEISGRLSHPRAIGDLSGIPDELPDALTNVTSEIAALFEQPEQDSAKLHGLLSRVAEVAYTATGNGYYLHLKGNISL